MEQGQSDSYCLSDLLKRIERFEKKDPIHSLFSDWKFAGNGDSSVNFNIEVFLVDSSFLDLNEINTKISSPLSNTVLSSYCKESILFEQLSSVPLNIEDDDDLRRCYVAQPLPLENKQLVLPIRYRTYGNLVEVIYLFELKDHEFLVVKKIVLSIS